MLSREASLGHRSMRCLISSSEYGPHDILGEGLDMDGEEDTLEETNDTKPREFRRSRSPRKNSGANKAKERFPRFKCNPAVIYLVPHPQGKHRDTTRFSG
jgi:hypothetical protein